uniref:Uncharacterized protein n=1 Tax=Nelumbo nucifera TaxID=4432 RepID=A0A822ZHB7_NELNU|nr:TPA_asm: hypothetical protein HUJ06_002253 [Nelumbo nucifera]
MGLPGLDFENKFEINGDSIPFDPDKADKCG